MEIQKKKNVTTEKLIHVMPLEKTPQAHRELNIYILVQGCGLYYGDLYHLFPPSPCVFYLSR